MLKIRHVITRRRLALFFLLAIVLSWWSIPFAEGALLPYGPAVAALIVLAVGWDRHGLGLLGQRLSHWRAGWWYLIGPTIIVGYQGIAFVINLLLGATIAVLPRLPSIETAVQLFLLGGLWEEIGWTGYALPTLRLEFSSHPKGSLIAVLVMGVLRAIWHLPLFLAGTIFWFDILAFEMGFQMIIAWIFFKSGGSLPAVMAFHFASNIAGVVMSPVFAGPARTNYYAIFMALALLVGLVLLRFGAPRLPKQGTPASDRLADPAT
jgi:hypothetical protein